MNVGEQDCFKPHQIEIMKEIYPEWRTRLFGLEDDYQFGYCGWGNNLIPTAMRERCLFEVNDPLGNVVGYAGRALRGQEPKYLNQRGYSKGRTLFNMHKLITAHDNSIVWVVEGIFDAMRGFVNGLPVVAVEGVWVTPTQIALLSKFKTVVLALDNDGAGKLATIITYFNLIEQYHSRVLWVDYGSNKDLDEVLSSGQTIPVAKPITIDNLVMFYKQVSPDDLKKYAFAGDAYRRLVEKLGLIEVTKRGLVKPLQAPVSNHKQKYQEYYR